MDKNNTCELDELFDELKNSIPYGAMRGNTLLTAKKIIRYINNFKKTDCILNDFIEFDKYFNSDIKEEWS